MFTDAINRYPNKEKEWIALVDGDPKQIQYLEKNAKKQAINITIICDFIHVLEYLWKASNVFFTEPSRRESWVKIVTGFTGKIKSSRCWDETFCYPKKINSLNKRTR